MSLIKTKLKTPPPLPSIHPSLNPPPPSTHPPLQPTLSSLKTAINTIYNYTPPPHDPNPSIKILTY